MIAKRGDGAKLVSSSAICHDVARGFRVFPLRSTHSVAACVSGGCEGRLITQAGAVNDDVELGLEAGEITNAVRLQRPRRRVGLMWYGYQIAVATVQSAPACPGNICPGLGTAFYLPDVNATTFQTGVRVFSTSVDARIACCGRTPLPPSAGSWLPKAWSA